MSLKLTYLHVFFLLNLKDIRNVDGFYLMKIIQLVK